MQRRIFLKQGAFALVTMGLSPTFLRRTVLGMDLPNVAKGKILICLFQRGAADALNVVVPHGEAEYYKIRPRIGIPRPRSGDRNSALDLDGFFGLQLASGQVPGANQSFWPLPDGIRRQPREAQVDAVVAAFLGGEASVETRAILTSGNNPMLKTAVDTAENMMRQPPDTAGVTGLDAAAMRRARGGRAFGPLPPLEGVPLIVGLALGSPEFQRR